MIANKIMAVLKEIKYGFLDENGHNIMEVDPEKWDKEFNNFYYIQTPVELLKSKYGTCFDQVELERYLFKNENIKVKTYFICTYDVDMCPSHTFLVYEENNKYYWFEHAWYQYKGIHEYANLDSLLKDVKNKFILSHECHKDAWTFVYEYANLPKHLTCDEMYAYCEKQKLIKLNEPLYFYHLVNKDADLTKGLLSLEYMYQNNMNDLFKKMSEKYLKRITDDWHLKDYQGKDPYSLTNDDIIKALNEFRGSNGASYIYFFRYPPFKALGKNMTDILKEKKMVRININDEELQKDIMDIFYGYEKSHSDNKLLDKEYYEKVTEKDYFKDYDDNVNMVFRNLNHIGIAFKDGYCKAKYLVQVEIK